MKNQAQKSVVLRQNSKNLMFTLLPIAKKVISDQINQIKSRIMKKLLPNKKRDRLNTPKKVSYREMKSLENNFNVKATKNMINTSKIVIEKSPIAAKPDVVISSKIATKPKKVRKPKIVDKPKVAIEKKYLNYDEYKNRVIKQLKKKLFDIKKVGI